MIFNKFVVSTTAAVIGAGIAAAGTAAGAAAAAGGWAVANAGAIAAGANIASQVGGAISAEEAKKQQQKMMKEQQDAQAAELNRQKSIALEKRTDMINKQRKQLVGSGSYNINKTASTGVAPSGIGGMDILG